MRKAAAELTVKKLSHYMADGEIGIVEPYGVEVVHQGAPEHVGITISSEGTVQAVGAALALQMMEQVIEKYIKDKKLRDKIVEEATLDTIVHLPMNRGERDGKIILY